MNVISSETFGSNKTNAAITREPTLVEYLRRNYSIKTEPEKSDWHKQQVADLKKRLNIT